MTPQQLKNSILQLAIQGKLVKQISEEGTGEELYKIIQEEKKKLIKKGEIRKQKSLPQIKSDEVPFSIPNTWKWVRLVDVGDWGSGGTPLRTNPNYYGGDIPWLKTGDLTDGEVREVSEYITDLALEKTSIRLNPTGSVLMAMYGATIGKLGILTRPMTTNQACCACIVYPNIFNKYLFYFLLASRNYFIKKGEGGAQPNISRTKIIETCIPLPPFKEQKRIVQKIEEILPLVKCYGNAWQKLKELNKKFPTDIQNSILQEAIQGKLVKQRYNEGMGEELYQVIQRWKKRLCESRKLKKEKELPPISVDEVAFTIPKTWTWVRLADIGDWRAGATPPRTNPNYYGGEIPWLKTGDLNDGDILEVSEHITDLALKETSVRLNPEGSVLMAMYGATIGKLGILTKPMTTNQACCACIVSPHLFNKYLFFFLMSNRKEFIKKGEGGAQPNISRTKIIETCMPLPPFKEQCRIVKKIEEISLLINQYQKLFRKI